MKREDAPDPAAGGALQRFRSMFVTIQDPAVNTEATFVQTCL